MQIKKCIFVGLISFLCTNVSLAEVPVNATDSVVRYNLAAVQQYRDSIKNVSGKPLFKQVCQDGESKNSVCEKDLFSDANVQMIQAIGLAQEYILVKHKKESVCSPAYRTSWNDDYISCTASDNSMFFEFKFDDVLESVDHDIQVSVGRAACKIHGGQLIKYGDDCNVTDKNMCNKIDKSLQRFGYNATFLETARAGKYYCEIQYNDARNSEELRTAYGIDNMRFRTLQLRSSNDLKFFIKRHVESVLTAKNIELSSFRCDDSFKTLHNGFSLKNVHDDILTCYVNNQPIDFVFDDMQESWNSVSDGGTAGLQCIAVNGGNYDGRRCLGLTETQCTQASKDIVGGTSWDPILETCVLNAADKAANVNRGIEVLTAVGLSAGVIVLTVATGGSSVAIVCAVVGTEAAIGGQIAITQERDAVATFTAKLSNCSSRQCVRNEMIWFINHGSNYINNLTESQIDAIDIEISDKISHLNMDIEDDRQLRDAFANAKDKNIIERCTGDALQSKKCFFDAATILFDFLPVTEAALKATGSLGLFSAKFGTKMPRTASALVVLRNSSTATKTLKTTARVMDKLDTTNDVYTATSSIIK